MSLDLLGHCGYAFIFTGIILLAHYKSSGWVLRLIGEFIWICIGIWLGMTSIWAWGVVFVLMDVYGYYKWKTGGQQNDL